MSSFFSDISPSWPSNGNLARYKGISGLTGGGGGGGGGGSALLRGGAGGILALATVDVDGAEDTLEEVGVCSTLVEIGSGCAAGLRVPFFFCKEKIQVCEEEKIGLTSGPPTLSNLPCVIGRTTPGFLFGTGRD